MVEFGKYLKTIGFILQKIKVKLCSHGIDPSKKLSDDECEQLARRSIPLTLRISGWQIVVTVPALVDDAHKLTKVVKVGAGDTECYE